jgi:hypothetical protein
LRTRIKRLAERIAAASTLPDPDRKAALTILDELRKLVRIADEED